MSNESAKNDDESLFRSEMNDVTPLKSDNKVKTKKKPKKPLHRSDAEDHGYSIDDVFSDSDIFDPGLEDTGPDILSFSRSGLQHSVLKKLRQGKQPIEQILDLHGLTVAEARHQLLAFLTECQTLGLRNVIIIHGKGFRSKDKPVIKPMVNRWLRSVDNVLAFHSAQAKDGGSGAVYVLLKNLKTE